MNNDNVFWISACSIAAVVILGITIAIQSYCIDHNAKIVELIKNGVDPVAAMCALQGEYGKNPVCIVLATKK